MTYENVHGHYNTDHTEDGEPNHNPATGLFVQEDLIQLHALGLVVVGKLVFCTLMAFWLVVFRADSVTFALWACPAAVIVPG